MIRLKTKIAAPFVAIIVLVPLLTLLVFNVAMRAYMLSQSKTELKNAVESTKYLLRQEAGKTTGSGETGIPALMAELNTALKASRLATDTEILLFDKDYALVYPQKADRRESFTTDALLSALQKTLPGTSAGEISVLQPRRGFVGKYFAGDDKYLVVSHVAKNLPYVIVFISSMNEANALIRRINTILIAIMAVAAILSTVAALAVSGSISRPIAAIGAFAKRIGKSEFAALKADRSSQEIYDLCNSMNEMAESLQRYDLAQRTFLQNASHELRTPLMSIQGYAEGIVGGVFPDSVAAANVIAGESKRLTALVEELLVLSRIENRTYGASMQPMNLSDLVKDFIQRINGLALKERKQIELDAQARVPVEADENLLSQVFLNVASNCLRHAHALVRIEVFAEKERAVIRIADDGNGIPPVDLPHIFERFYKGVGGNFGLGLSIALSAATYMKGGIDVRNTEKGAQFDIWLPLQKE